MSNSFPASFPVVFEQGPYQRVTGKPSEIPALVDAIQSEVTSVDGVEIVVHGARTVTAVVAYTP